MEGLKTRAYLLGGAFAVVGLFALLRTSQAAETRMTERQMEEKAPQAVAGYQLVPGPEGLAYTYKMDPKTYEILKPFGIVARQYSNGAHTWDVVLITSDSHESFHDPKICFSGQGWTFKSSREERLELPDGRTIPMTIVEMAGPVSDSFAAYFYRGPKGFVSDPKRLQLDMFSEVLFGRKPADSTFYRFMPVTQGSDLEQLKGFIKTYMVSAAQHSGGFY